MAGETVDEIVQQDRAQDPFDRRNGLRVRHDNAALHAGKPLDHLGDLAQAVVGLAVVEITVRWVNRNFGSIWPNRSSTPLTPKSGEQDDQIPPSDAVASIATTASRDVRHETGDPVSRLQAAVLQRARQSGNPRTQFRSRQFGPPVRARRCIRWRDPPAPLGRSRFSAKFSRASGNQRAPGSASRFSATRFPAFRGHDAAVVPDQGPEILGVFHRPAVQGPVVDGLAAGAIGSTTPEPGEQRLLGPVGPWAPKWFHGFSIRRHGIDVRKCRTCQLRLSKVPGAGGAPLLQRLDSDCATASKNCCLHKICLCHSLLFNNKGVSHHLAGRYSRDASTARFRKSPGDRPSDVSSGPGTNGQTPQQDHDHGISRRGISQRTHPQADRGSPQSASRRGSANHSTVSVRLLSAGAPRGLQGRTDHRSLRRRVVALAAGQKPPIRHPLDSMSTTRNSRPTAGRVPTRSSRSWWTTCLSWWTRCRWS